MDAWVTVLVFLVAAPIAYCLGAILGVLRSVHKELVLVRLAAQSFHDRALPQLLMRSHACDCGGAYCPDRRS